jgi:hypothetical protein
MSSLCILLPVGLAELVAGAKTRSRKRRTPSPETPPQTPSLDLGDATGGQP